MKKFLFTLTFMAFGIVSYAQEKPQDAEKHVCEIKYESLL